MRTNWIWIVPLILYFLSHAAVATTPEPGTTVPHPETRDWTVDRDYWRQYLNDAKSVFTAPTRWDRKDWLRASLIVGITVALYDNDQQIRDQVQQNRDPTSDTLARIGNAFGDGRVILPALAGLYLYGDSTNNTKLRKTGLLGLESLVISGLVVHTIKLAGQRHRPNSGDPYNTWDGPTLSTDNLSFPSGHTAAAFAVATVFAGEYGEHRLVPVVAYGLATLTGLARINDDAHWASDVFVGAVIGHYTAKTILRHHSRRGAQGTFLPYADGKTLALAYVRRF